MKLTIKQILLMVALIPLFCTVLLISGLSIYEVNKTLYENQETMVKIAEQGFDGNVDKYKSLGIDITVFEGDTRVESSIKDSIGTKASEKVIQEVLQKGNTYLSKNVDVNGESYVGYYVPTENGMLFAGKPNSTIKEALNKVIITMLITSIISTIIFILIVVYVARLIGNLMKDSAKGLNNVSSGDLKQKEAFEKDAITKEINEINKAAINMVDNLRGVVGKTGEVSLSLSDTSKNVSATAETVLSATNEISIAIEEIANGATEQSGAVQNIAESLSGITESMEEAKKNVSDMSNYSETVEHNSMDMKEKINESIVSMEKMSNGVTEINRQIEKTNELFEQMKGFIDIIDDIADQTKLLSINASIEAAHAGESGRGFAVVAENIKAMSDDTAKQAKEISIIIEGLIKDFAGCMDSIKGIVSDNEKQKESMNFVVNTFETLDINIKQTRNMILEVEGHIKSVSERCVTVASDAEEMTAIAENSAAATEEITASIQEVNATLHGLEGEAKELAEDAKTLEEELKFFSV